MFVCVCAGVLNREGGVSVRGGFLILLTKRLLCTQTQVAIVALTFECVTFGHMRCTSPLSLSGAFKMRFMTALIAGEVTSPWDS